MTRFSPAGAEPPSSGSVDMAVAGARARSRPGRRTVPPSPVLADGMLKLMLILLAFFVFLHSRSEFAERKVTPILDSLALRFAASVAEDGLPEAEALAMRGDPAIQLRRRLLGHLPISATRVDVPGALLAFDLDEALLFEAGAAEVARERLVLLRRLAAALAVDAPDQPLELALTAAWPDGDAALVTRRLAALEDVFADTPKAAARLRLGFGELPAGRWRFLVRRSVPDAD